MRHFFVFTIVLICLSGISCNSSKHSGKNASMPGNWQSQPIVVDGDCKDWPSPYPNYDGKALIGYATSNDKQYLYVTMETGDEMTQMKILKSGMTVWVDTEGGKGQSFTINYPMQDDGEPFEMERQADKRQGPGAENKLLGRDFSQKVKRAISGANQMSIEGGAACSGGFVVTQKNPCGIIVRVGIDEYKELIWEAAIPFKAIYNLDSISRKDAGRPISVCFSIKGFKKPKGSNVDNNAAAGMGSAAGGMGGRSGGMGSGGGRGGRGGGRGPGGGHGNMTNPMDRLYENTKTWKYFGLAYL